MAQLPNLSNWDFGSKKPDGKQLATVCLHFKSVPPGKIRPVPLKDRTAYMDQHYTSYFKKLMNKYTFETYKIIGKKHRPYGIETVIPLKDVTKYDTISYIKNVFISSIKGARKIPVKKTENLFCIKMTVAIQVEGIITGFQDYEERYVLVKATSSEEAYEKVEKSKRGYGKPYLNTEGFIVRWKIESMDDCFETDITEIFNFNDLEPAEVYSILKRRKLTKERTWDGKTK